MGKLLHLESNPTYPETGYGYLQLEKDNKLEPKQVLKFIEKPNIKLQLKC